MVQIEVNFEIPLLDRKPDQFHDLHDSADQHTWLVVGREVAVLHYSLVQEVLRMHSHELARKQNKHDQFPLLDVNAGV